MYCEVSLPGLGTLWRSQGGPEASVIPADGCADIILRDDELLIAGPSTRWLLARGGEQGWTVGLRFQPGLVGAALGADPLAFQDRLVRAGDVLPPSALRRAASSLRTLAVPEGRPRPDAFHELARAASRTLDIDLDRTVVAWAAEVRAAADRGESGSQLASRFGYSERQFRRRTGLAFGYGYAALRRVLRAERARAAILAGVVPAAAAQLAGYADQPHLTREFQRVVGATPAQVAAGAASVASSLELSGSGA